MLACVWCFFSTPCRVTWSIEGGDEFGYENVITTHFASAERRPWANKWVSEGDLVWTRDAAVQYYPAEVTSGWGYWASQEANDLDIDVANIFRVVFKSVDIDAVPGKIVASFRAKRSIQEIADKKHENTQSIYGTHSQTSRFIKSTNLGSLTSS
jgi:hypothetical protein